MDLNTVFDRKKHHLSRRICRLILREGGIIFHLAVGRSYRRISHLVEGEGGIIPLGCGEDMRMCVMCERTKHNDNENKRERERERETLDKCALNK